MSDDAFCSFVPMEYVEELFGTIRQKDTRRVGEVKKGYTFFRENDVLFAKITPCMENGKCAVARNLTNGIAFGSTEYHVIRAGNDIVPAWIFYFLRQEKVRQDAKQWFRGTAGQQRVPADFLEQLGIYLPPLSEQQRIAAILQKADRIRRLRHLTRQLSDSFLQSVFLEMFGEKGGDVKKWNVISLGKVVEINPPGRTKGSSNQLSSFLPMTMVNPSAIFTEELEVRKFSDVSVGYTYFENGDVLFAKITPCMENGNIVVAKNLINGFGFGSTEFHVIRPNEKANSYWLYGLVKLLKFREQAKQWFRGTAGQQRVPSDFLEEYNIALPPIELQNSFADIVIKFNKFRIECREAERQAENLFQSLLRRAYAGGL
jgi:type I restriction enzyme S subunit